ncbi:hypothetical protein SAMN02745704_02566 [Paucidesulfovibrio gracilis DSM 16080]|uniref:Uncharacterized protein n=2 Tax=Paucidesulfovibrio TaxID=2910985 RepID=A0A1T4XZ57_9BACT|nr:hypothetical protein SAMN02745704_02566 [Paucidesulfovibrio gracilis DSM 16080]
MSGNAGRTVAYPQFVAMQYQQDASRASGPGGKLPARTGLEYRSRMVEKSCTGTGPAMVPHGFAAGWRYLRFWLGVAMFLAVAACARPMPDAENAYQGLTLPQYLATVRDAQAFRLNQLYKPSVPLLETADGTGRYGPGYHLFSHGPATLDLAPQVSDFQGSRSALALGTRDGQIRVYGAFSCARTDLPVPGAVRNMAWRPDSPYLAVQGQARDVVYVYDVRRCERTEELAVPAPVQTMAVSSGGRFLALADDAGRIWFGSPSQEPKPLADLGGTVLALGFGPEGGMLFSVSPQGRITLINARESNPAARIMDRFQARGGPFAQARFQGRYLVLTTAAGRRFAWDLQTRTQVPFSRKMAQFFLDDGVLRYTTWGNVPHLAEYAGYPEFDVRHCPKRHLIRVRDLDGMVRLYDSRTGLLNRTLVPDAGDAAEPCASGWQRVSVNAKGNFCLEDNCYMLTDRAFQWDHDMLLCRSVPGVGRFLWWMRAEQPDQFSPLPDHLPERRTILSDEAVEWAPVLPPPDFP